MSKLLITGGTGSFGKAFLENQINNDKFEEIRIFSRDEKKQDDLRKSIDSKKVKFYIGDVRDLSSIQPAIESVDYVFHAAALKQVPSCEFFPIEAVKTNILGANNVLTLAKQENVKRLVILSTDKAAYPVNVMGMSKALMEKVMISNSRNLDSKNRIFCGTRYGNVMASRGSVIPLFINQIKSNKDITITNPEMTRFMMSLNEAVKLVYYAFENGNNGELLKGNSEFNMFMDYISKANTESLRNQIIDQWMIHLDEADQNKLVNKLRERGIMFVPAENRQFYEV